MKKIIMKKHAIISVAIFALFISVDNLHSQDTSGMQLFRQASDYVFSARRLSFIITNIDKKGNPYYNTGFFVALPDRGYMKVDGVSEVQFTPTLLSAYSYDSNELVFQPRKTTAESVADNPFSILHKSDKGISVSVPQASELQGKACMKFSITPEGRAYYSRADVYVAGQGNSFKVLRITVVLKNNQAFVMDITKAGPSEPDKISDYQLMVSEHPGAHIVDLRN